MVVPVSTATWQWPPDVLEFAARHNLQTYLEPLREATQRVFPAVRQIRITLESDHEIRDLWWIVFEVKMPAPDVPNYVEAVHRWNREGFKIVPAPLVHFFILSLDLVTP